MPYLINDDGDELNIRAFIRDRLELKEFVDKLQLRLDGKDVNITTPIATPVEKATPWLKKS